jgi:hypothetical protein
MWSVIRTTGRAEPGNKERKMEIVIELGDEVSNEAEALINQAVAACGRQEVDFNGDSIEVRRGDFTCIADGYGHSDAARLFALVQRIAQDPAPFQIDEEGYVLIPLSDGGFEKHRDA